MNTRGDGIKMLTLNVSCPVCKVPFKSADAVYSTSCGHVFHFYCMNQWKCKSTSCPQCRSYNPTTHSIYLNFDDAYENEKIFNDLNAKVEDFTEKLKKSQEENDKKTKKIDDIKRLYNVSEQWRAELENKLHALSLENQVKNANHTREMNLKLTELETLKAHINTLEKEKGTEMLCEKINEFSTENTILKKKLKECEATEIILEHKLETLEHRLKQITSELQNQIAETFDQKFSLTDSKENINAPNPQKKRTTQKQKKNQTSNEKDLESLNTSGMAAKPPDDSRTTNEPKERAQFKLSNSNNRNVIITDFPKYYIVYPLKDTVKLLAAIMSITFEDKDILKVEFIAPKRSSLNTSSNKVVILAEFKDIEGKTKFLSYRNRLKLNSWSKFIKIKDYIDEATYALFMYANRNLRGNGYQYVVYKGDKVIAKRNLHDTADIVIENKNHVDSLLLRQRQTLITTNHLTNDYFTPSSPLYSNEQNIPVLCELEFMP